MPSETHVNEHGLWIPPALREFTAQIVFRTPSATIQHFGSTELDPYYGMIDEDHFGPEEKLHRPQNPDLAPDRVSIKPQGEPVVMLEVKDVR